MPRFCTEMLRFCTEKLPAKPPPNEQLAISNGKILGENR
jgi:hypothetical protein